MRALYDLRRYLASFNFFEWAVQAATLGATTVVFDVRMMRFHKWSRENTVRRFESICVPGAALAGLRVEMVESDEQLSGTVDLVRPGGAQIVRFCRGRNGDMIRLRSVLPPASERYTVTLRRTQRSPARDSNEEAWRTFAREIGARVIEDYDVEPLHLHERVALYAGARMNFFVSNGPGVLCSLTEYPCMMFNTHHAAGTFKSDGIGGWGSQYPWMLANQRALWVEDSLVNLRRHFLHWEGTGAFLNDDDRALDEPAAT